MNWEYFNFKIFHFFNASAHPNEFIKEFALFSSEYLTAVVVFIFLVLAVAKRNHGYWRAILLFLFSYALALCISKFIAIIYYHPRPFALQMGNALISHRDNSSLPSRHMLFIATFAFSFLKYNFKKSFYFIGIASIIVGWSRMYLGVHFPADLFCAIILASICVYLVKAINISMLRKWKMQLLHKFISPSKPKLNKD